PSRVTSTRWTGSRSGTAPAGARSTADARRRRPRRRWPTPTRRRPPRTVLRTGSSSGRRRAGRRLRPVVATTTTVAVGRRPALAAGRRASLVIAPAAVAAARDDLAAARIDVQLRARAVGIGGSDFVDAVLAFDLLDVAVARRLEPSMHVADRQPGLRRGRPDRRC